MGAMADGAIVDRAANGSIVDLSIALATMPYLNLAIASGIS